MANPQTPDPVSSGSPLPANPFLRYAQPFVEATPLQSFAASGSPLKPRRRAPIAAVSPPSDGTGWLPAGWVVEARARINGATAGFTDKYYIEPVTLRRFRSKKEVEYYLETGDTLQNKRKREAADSKPDVNSPELTENRKEKGPQMTYDHTNFPDNVDWVLTDESDDEWSPHFGDEEVPEDSKECWEFEVKKTNPYFQAGGIPLFF